MRNLLPLVASTLLLALVVSCASVEFERTTPTSGTFRSSAVAFTLLSNDFPAPALSTARANVMDAHRENLRFEQQVVTPYLGWFDWLLDIVCIRYASVRGTWGHPTDG